MRCCWVCSYCHTTVFLEAPESIEEMKAFCQAAPKTPKLANMIEGGKTPVLPPKELEKMGYKIAAYPLTLLSTSINAMNKALSELKDGRDVSGVLSFAEMRDIVGFNDYYREEDRYKIGDSN
jgi:2-methylisocitrate lyase-like PEP mutase family enzyme